MLLQIVCLFVAGLYAYLYYCKLQIRAKLPPLAGAGFGSFGRVLLLLWNVNRLYDFILDQSRRLGLLFYIDLPLYGNIYVMIRPDDVKHMLADNFDNYVKGPIVHDALHDLLGDGIFTTDGDVWKAQRQAASHLFKKRLMNEACRVILSHAKDVDSYFSEKLNVDFDVQQLFSSFTMDSFIEIAFGRHQSSLRKKEPFQYAFDDTTQALIFRLCFPMWSWLPRTPKMQKDLKIIRDFANEVIEERRNDAAAGQLEQKEDILARFMSLSEKVTDCELRDVVLNLLVAGRDTTAQLLTWCCYSLAENQAVQTKLVEHIKEVIGNNEINMESVKSMPYLQAVMDETLRLYPPVPIDIKQAVKDDMLPCGAVVPAKTMVVWSAYAMGRSEVLWGRDWRRFEPSRWLDAAKPVPPHFAIPFQTGPRICLGMNFAYLEVKCFLCYILPKFEFVMSTNSPPPKIGSGVTLRALDGCYLQVRKRK